MKFSILAIVAAIAAGVQASALNSNSSAFTTEVVTAYVTYVPAPTTIVHGDLSFVATTAGPLTITNCPCTITRPLTSKVVSACGGESCAKPTVSAAPIKPANGTTGYVSPTKTGSVATFTGAAGNVVAGSGALAAVLGFAILAL